MKSRPALAHRRGQSGGESHVGHVAPGPEGAVTGGSMPAGGEAVATELEERGSGRGRRGDAGPAAVTWTAASAVLAVASAGARPRPGCRGGGSGVARPRAGSPAWPRHNSH